MKKGILLIMLANLVYLLISILINFMLPKYLDIVSYAEIKSFILYINYAGLFHLGLIDGVYLKYGGKKIQELNTEEYKADFIGLVCIELFFSFTVFLIGLFCRDFSMVTLSFGLFVFNILSFFRSFYQAVGQFGSYSRVLGSESILLFLCYSTLIFGAHCYALSGFYIWSRIIIVGSLCLYCYVKLRLFQSKWPKIVKIVNNAIENIKQGILLMLGNFATVLFSGIDRWFVLLFIDKYSFAIFAFAVSLEQAVNAFISPISISMYNYMCQHRDMQKIKLIKKTTLLWGFLVVAGGFFVKLIIEKCISKYMDALPLIFILFASIAISTVIGSIYLNLYKVERKQSQYFTQMIMMLIVAVILDFFLYHIFGNLESIAFATFLVKGIWLAVCELLDKRTRFSLKDVFVMVVLLALYLFCGLALSTIMGFIVYMTGYILISLCFMKKEITFALNNMKNINFSKIGKRK